jgi:perosamine synthetase
MIEALAIRGGTPVRDQLLPYGRQQIDEDDINAVSEVLRSDWLTTGPKIGEFEQAFAQFVGAREAVAVSNGTAALHAAAYAAGIQPGDEVIVTPMTFAASANCVLYLGGKPVFADVDSNTLLIDPQKVAEKITPRTRAIIAVDYAGQPCQYDALRELAQEHNLILIDDACHALGAAFNGCPVGTLADLNTFSLHPVKHVTTGEGGIITTDNPDQAKMMRVFRNHGITTDHRQRAQTGSFFYEMVDLGFNYRLTDFQCALGISQLRKQADWLRRRQAIAAQYDEAFNALEFIQPLSVQPGATHAYHLYVVRLDLTRLGVARAEVFKALRAENIGVNVHYIPVHLHPYYRSRLGTQPGLCPIAEAAYEQIISLPIFPAMSQHDVNDVLAACRKLSQFTE